MKILLVDDSSARVDAISQLTRGFGDNCYVEVASNAQNAKERLSESVYDLVVVDIHIPSKAVDQATAQSGLDLIRQIKNNPRFKTPFLVMGITSVDENFDEHYDLLQSESTNLVKYEPGSDGWLQVIKFALANISRKKSKEVDILIITTTEIEERAALNLPNVNWSKKKFGINSYINYTVGQSTHNGKIYKIACIRSYRMGMIESSIVSSIAIKDLNPRITVMTGICAGIKGKSELGDLLIASEAWDWQSGKYFDQEGQSFHAMAPDTLRLDDQIRRQIEDLRSEILAMNQINSLFLGRDSRQAPNVIVAPIVSGSAVVADQELVAKIQTQHRNIAGIDMEIYGFYAAIRANPEIKTLYFAAKSVVDLGDKHKNDNLHHFSSTFSAYFCVEMAFRLLEQA